MEFWTGVRGGGLAGLFKAYGNFDAITYVKIGALCEVRGLFWVSEWRHAAGVL